MAFLTSLVNIHLTSLVNIHLYSEKNLVQVKVHVFIIGAQILGNLIM